MRYPEYGKSWEAGYKIDINNRVTGTLAVYDIHKRNIMVSELVDGETVTRTAGKARSRGLELDMAGKVTDSLSLIGSYAYTDARLTEDPDNNGNDLPNVARHTAALFLSRDFGSTSLISGDEVKAGIGARYVGKRAGDAANSFWLDNYTVADAFIAWKMPLSGYQLKWQLNVKTCSIRRTIRRALTTCVSLSANHVRLCCRAVSISNKQRALLLKRVMLLLPSV